MPLDGQKDALIGDLIVALSKEEEGHALVSFVPTQKSIFGFWDRLVDRDKR